MTRTTASRSIGLSSRAAWARVRPARKARLRLDTLESREQPGDTTDLFRAAVAGATVADPLLAISWVSNDSSFAAPRPAPAPAPRPNPTPDTTSAPVRTTAAVADLHRSEPAAWRGSSNATRAVDLSRPLPTAADRDDFASLGGLDLFRNLSFQFGLSGDGNPAPGGGGAGSIKGAPPANDSGTGIAAPVRPAGEPTEAAPVPASGPTLRGSPVGGGKGKPGGGAGGVSIVPLPKTLAA